MPSVAGAGAGATRSARHGVVSLAVPCAKLVGGGGLQPAWARAAHIATLQVQLRILII